MNVRRRGMLLCGASLLLARGVRAREAASRMARIGLFIPDRREEIAAWVPEFHRMLAELGYQEGRNIELVWRYLPEGDADTLARELVGSGVDVVMTQGSETTRALQRASSTLPIVTTVGDPVAMGFAQSLVRPGGNITGTSSGASEAGFKQLELLQQMVPDLKRLAIFGRKENPVAHDIARPLERFAASRGIATEFLLMTTLERIERDLKPRRGPGRRAAAFSHVTIGAPAVVAMAARHGVPTMFPDRAYVELGGLLSYELFHRDNDRRGMVQVDRILRGMKPADIPFELPTGSYFALNLRTARGLGLAVPGELLVRADKVYE